MAANPCADEIPAIVDGSCDLPVAGSCFQFVKPSFDEVNQQCTLDVLPLLFEEASFPMEKKCAFQTQHGQDVYSISMLSEEDKVNSKCTSQLALLSFVELPVSPKKQICLDPQLNCQNFIGLQMESADAYSPCIVDINIEMENFEKPKSNDETVGSIKSEGLLTGVLQRQASLKTCGRFMQLLSNPGSTLLKLISKGQVWAL
ncbi:uncharacterized protein LOC105647814 isoform X2 [Jatropha curcas]|uniref:uncharacterized protein LOC105647814 isoform X2 n=1 Tax=Jatropha curcas TaxID=180498 RepID=UPI0009D77894|nr:uncharacterized protein LOC105647814 isoform X2 [Jatropha curcas]